MNKTKIALDISVYAFVLMFILAGAKKLYHSGKGGSYKRFVKLFNVSESTGQNLVLFGGAWELCGALWVLYALYTQDHKMFRVGVQVLLAFTFAATAIFKLPLLSDETLSKKSIGLLSNISLMGCMLFISLTVDPKDL